jgi:hypothetical protein
MNNYKDIMENLDDKSDIQTDEELLLFSERIRGRNQTKETQKKPKS